MPRFQALPGNAAAAALPPFASERGRASSTAFQTRSQEREKIFQSIRRSPSKRSTARICVYFMLIS
ncbi:MAG: hypothetical protein HC879_12415 [Leptolyngbyaceae cyanobacterium SL_5_9]|nr:hypothetical protein [Leptolyngbyaceae cyanobacterium SL_5_9]NJO76038.1 hypothetical protein [Leptolyngbyaceae cyanobacterium RM1_406_9]